MELAHLHELSTLEQNYWWHVAKRSLVTNWLTEHAPPPGFVIEGGIGSAGNLVAFQKMGYDVAGLDIMPAAVAYGKEQGIANVAVHDLQQPWPFPHSSASAVVLLDVIEHVAEPVTVLKNAWEMLDENGIAIVTVPAYQWLYGGWDKALGHHRRYSLRQFREHALAAGFSIKKLTHWNSFTLPAALGVRTWQKLRPSGRSAEFPRVSPWVNRILLQCAQAERAVSELMPIPCGLSIASLLVKTSEPSPLPSEE